jgi:hypothetical protein
MSRRQEWLHHRLTWIGLRLWLVVVGRSRRGCLRSEIHSRRATILCELISRGRIRWWLWGRCQRRIVWRKIGHWTKWIMDRQCLGSIVVWGLEDPISKWPWTLQDARRCPCGWRWRECCRYWGIVATVRVGVGVGACWTDKLIAGAVIP